VYLAFGLQTISNDYRAVFYCSVVTRFNKLGNVRIT